MVDGRRKNREGGGNGGLWAQEGGDGQQQERHEKQQKQQQHEQQQQQQQQHSQNDGTNNNLSPTSIATTTTTLTLSTPTDDYTESNQNRENPLTHPLKPSKNNLPPDDYTEHLETLFHQYVVADNHSAVKLLLATGLDVNCTRVSQWTGLHFAGVCEIN